MRQSLITILFAVLIVFGLARQIQTSPVALRQLYALALEKYKMAEELSGKAGDNEELLKKSDLQFGEALDEFKSLAVSAEKSGYDSLLFFTRVNIGYIEYILGRTEEAREDYLRAIELKKRLPVLEDSLLFKPYLFTGGFYYNKHDFDSALYYYHQALSLIEKYGRELEESQRLYNRLGVMYYETGNYRQAKNYIEKALSIQEKLGDDAAFLANYRLNIASLLVKLEEFEEASALYENLLKEKYFRNEILHNLSIISLKKNDPGKALEFLRQVNYGNERKNLDLFYNYAMAFAQLGQKDSSNYYVQEAKQENEKWNGQRENATFGLLLKFEADELAKAGLYPQAIARYQLAIRQFAPGFINKDPRENPGDFTSVYSYINLFQTLAAKADAQAAVYRQDGQQVNLRNSLATYHSAYALADHVEKTYDSDEARLFLNRIKHTVHSKPIDNCILLYELSKERDYLEQAYYFDQRNKASVLAFHIREMELRSMVAVSDEILSGERQLRSAITRYSLQALQTTDSLKLQSLNDTIRDMNIELGRIQEKINANPIWNEIGSFQKVPAIRDLSARLDKKTALLSYHLSDKELVTIYITQDKLGYNRDTISDYFITQVNIYKEQLHLVSGQLFPDISISRYLYTKLLIPVLDKIGKADRLVIIPDDELNYLPFEALQDMEKNYLVEKFTVQYQYSTALLGAENDPVPLRNVLALAPFTSRGGADSTSRYSRLPASGEEVSTLKGKILFDTAATKQAFMTNAGDHGIIHLATHAIVNNEDPFRSFIAFYPNRNFRLYSAEIANLDLSKTQLVILSACETGMGKLVKGEGLLSLSRAFAYAGCHNIITSLWKAEDNSTALLSKRLHHYLGENYSKDRALQLAKKDLLQSPDIDPRLKSPSFWSHLVFIGHYEQEGKSLPWFWMVVGMVVTAAILLFIKFYK